MNDGISDEIIVAGQGTAQWLYDRVGHCTMSRADDVIALKKDGTPKAERENYMWEIVMERITGEPSDHWTSFAMKRGIELEPLARLTYESITGELVEQVGFVRHKSIALVGASSDGIIAPDGGIEIKCPLNPQRHLSCFINGMPKEHTAQIQGSMWVNGGKWRDFVSFDPRINGALQIYIQRIDRDDKFIASMEAAIVSFLAECDALHQKLLEVK